MYYDLTGSVITSLDISNIATNNNYEIVIHLAHSSKPFEI